MRGLEALLWRFVFETCLPDVQSFCWQVFQAVLWSLPGQSFRGCHGLQRACGFRNAPVPRSHLRPCQSAGPDSLPVWGGPGSLHFSKLTVQALGTPEEQALQGEVLAFWLQHGQAGQGQAGPGQLTQSPGAPAGIPDLNPGQ